MSDEQTVSKDKDGKKEKRTLHLAGYSYIVGDAAMIGAGLMRKGGEAWRGTVGGAVIWSVGGIAAALFGNPSPQKQLEIQASKLERHLKKNGITIPKDAREKSDLLKDRGFWGHVADFLHKHPSEMLNAMYGIGAVGLLLDGQKEFGHNKGLLPGKIFHRIEGKLRFNHNAIEPMNTDFWMGALILTGALVGLLVKEDPDAKKKSEGKGFFAKVHAFIAEKPLRTTSALYTANNAILLGRVIQDFGKYKNKVGMKPQMFSTVQLASYLFANSMLLMSNRDQITNKGFSTDELGKLEDAAARIIASQPREVQQKVLADISEYMAKEKGIKVDAPTIAQHLAARVGKVTEGNLQETATNMKWAERESARKHTAAEVQTQAIS